MKKLTIIVPTYNMEQYLNRCLDSLIPNIELAKDLEVLVIIDGAKDKSSSIAHEYQEKRPDIFRVIDKENGNYGSCFNRGLKEAQGEYIRLLDADDWVDIQALSSFIDCLNNCQQSDVVITNYTECYSNGGKKVHELKNVEIGMTFDIDKKEIFNKVNTPLICMHALSFRTQFLRDIHLYLDEGISYTDSEYCFYPLMYAKTVQYCNVNLYQYFLGREGQTVSREGIIKNLGAFYQIQKRLLNDYIKTDLSNLRKNILLKIFKDGLLHVYGGELLYLKHPRYSEEFIVIENIANSKPELKRITSELSFKKIPYVKIWRITGIKIGSFIGK